MDREGLGAFATGGKVSRSPPLKQRSHSIATLHPAADLSEVEGADSPFKDVEVSTVRQEAKRRRMISPSDSDSEQVRCKDDEQKLKKLLYVIRELEKQASELALAVQNAPTTKGEVRAVAKRVARLGVCSREYGLSSFVAEAGNFCTQRKREGVNSVGTQTDIVERMKGELTGGLTKEEVWRRMNPSASFEDFKALATETWPEGSFRRVKEVPEELTPSVEGALVYSFREERLCSMGGAPQLHIEFLSDEEIRKRAGKVAHLQSRLDLPDEESSGRVRHAFCLFSRETREDPSAEVLYRCIGALREKVRHH